ncbi:hypothetical protein [Thalassococcus sp. S3]|uniref:hypothetical protein n=1 Tax=Thalassococcus sp. S3 TaxID=2017482 RepID=UPI001023FC8F|nr:hypothetical protein [Thalassococcus sp. S3]QBF31612.1 hypothetical protein CFI11_10340 [Thalassococcus sp. S3]
MRLAFLTMVWRDYWLLDKWVSHNEKLVPRRQLYVVNHGGDPEVDRIAEGCNLIHVPRDEITPDLTRRRWDLVGGITNGLLAFHDRVICTDVDELLVYTGSQGSLLDHLGRAPMEGQALSPVGLNLIPTPEDAEDETLPVLQRHPNALVSAKYTKPCIAGERVVYTVGGHGLVRGRFRIDPEILLFHLHYVTPDYAERMAARQDIVSASKAQNENAEAPLNMPKRHWINWAKPDMIRDKEFGIFARARALDVAQGFDQCAEILRGAVVSEGKKTVVEPAIVTKDPVRIVVPKALYSAI